MKTAPGVAFFVPAVPRATQVGKVVQVRGPAGVVLVNGRPRVVAGKTELVPIRRRPEWARTVKAVALQHRPATVIEGPLHVDLVFQVPAPIRRNPTGVPDRKPDLENYLKGTLDALNGVIYRDDAQIVSLTARKLYTDAAHSPGVLIAVLPIVDMFAPADPP
jgi:Holliday junction resolvase RusA-like endonuclease